MKRKYFGPEKFRKDFEEQVPAPVGEKCLHCEEPITAHDVGTMMPFISDDFQGERPVHHECSIRSVAGSVGHQMKQCSCYGGTMEDPEGMTPREAAIAAAEYFYKHHEF